MATAYRYTGSDARDYPTLGFHVEPGDLLYLDGRPPDASFVEVEPGSMETSDEPPVEGADWRRDAFSTSDVPRRPNKAAAAADWVEFAKADGSFEEATGTLPEDATRRAIVEHYSSDPEPEQPDPEPESEAAIDDTPAPPAPADPADDAPKEV
jgi:hypothetical protein